MGLRITFGIIALLITPLVLGQDRIITGKVTDETDDPLTGVNVLLVGTNSGTLTDTSGRFSLEGESGQFLRFSFVGFLTQNVQIDQQDEITVVMRVDVAALDEVLVIGYGTQNRRTVTDNIVKLTTEDIEEVPTPSVFNTIVGKAAGVQVTQTNGKVESGLNFRIRGQASIRAGNEPLYVLDGIPLFNQDQSTDGRTNPLITLSANEIESIDILKDASAAAIYGARGANGVVVITTKRGKPGEATFSLNFSNGISEPANTRDWLNAEQYVELLLESAQRSPFGDLTDFVTSNFDFISDGTWQDGTYDTDWQDIALRDGYVRDMDFSISGGDEKTRYFFSGAYNDTKGIVDGNELDRFSARINLDHTFSKKFSAGMNMSFSRTEIDRVANDNSFVTPLQAIAQSPISPARIDGEPFENTFYANYLLEDKYAFFKTTIRRISGKVFGAYQFTDFLTWRTDFAYDFFAHDENYYGGPLSPFNEATNGYSYLTSSDTENYIVSNYLTYEKVWKDAHSLNTVVGMEINEATGQFGNVEGTQFPSGDFQTLSSAAEIIDGGGGTRKYSFVSYFLRASYAFKEKYLLKGSIRRDGSSRFGENNRFGTFPALSAGWILTEESFLKESNWLDFLKVRASWGETGNAEIPNQESRNLFVAASYDQRPGIRFTNAGNPDLTWENTTQTDIALEFGLFNYRLSGEVAVYSKNTTDLLFARPIPPSQGNPQGDGITSNIGELSNRGFEITLSTKNVETDSFSWKTDFNLSHNDIEVKELPNGEDVLTFSQIILREGEAPQSLYLIEYAGVDSDNGDALYYLNTENADGSLNRQTTNDPNEAQRIVAGQPLPIWIAGFTNTFVYKDFDLNFTFSGEWGASIFNFAGIYQSANGDWFDNQTVDQLQRWQNPGDITNVPEARFAAGNGTDESTRYVEEGDFIRLRNVILGYNFPQSLLEKIGINKCRIYLSGLNLLTITDFSGYDPESRADSFGVNNGSEGATFYSAPAARTYSIGINLSF